MGLFEARVWEREPALEDGARAKDAPEKNRDAKKQGVQGKNSALFLTSGLLGDPFALVLRPCG